MTRNGRPSRTNPRGGARSAIVIALLTLVGAAGIVLLITGPSQSSKDDAGEQPSDASSETSAPNGDPGLARRVPDDPMAIGDPEAPVAIVEYADFRCPFCAKYAQNTLPSLIEKYVDAGLVRYEFRDVPLFGAESENAALAGRAAANQGRFWEFFDALYGSAPESGHPPLPRQRLIELAKEAGVPDLERFERDMDAPETRRGMEADMAEAQQLGVTSVPSFVVDDVALAGAQPLEVFEQVIDEQLAERDLPTKE